MRILPWLAAVAVAALMLAPTSAPAAVRTLKGTVVGSAYPAGKAIAVPVLLDARSTRRAKLRTPLARVLVPRTWKVRAPGRTTIAAQNLRAGDAFRMVVKAPRRRNASAHPSLRPRVRTFAVTRRGTALSAAELQEHVAALYGYVGALANYVVVEFASLNGQVAGLRGDLAGLRGDLAGLRGALTALEARVDALEAGFQAQIDQLMARVTALETQLASITSQLAQLTGDVSALQAKLAGIAPGDLADALSDISALQALVGGIDVTALSGSLSTLSGSLNSLSSSTAASDAALAASDAALQGNIDAANATLASVQGQVAFLCSAGLVTGPLLSLSLAGSCPA